MNTVRGWIDFWNRKVKDFSIWDVKLAQIWTAAWLLVAVKIFPQIMELSIWWWVALIALCIPRFCYILAIRKSTSCKPGFMALCFTCSEL